MNLWPQNNGFRGINDERRVMVMADDLLRMVAMAR